LCSAGLIPGAIDRSNDLKNRREKSAGSIQRQAGVATGR
jgi:hypothetical protein